MNDCPACGNDADSYECGRSDEFDCFIDPTPAERWEVTTPAAVYATGYQREEWLP